MDPTANLSTIAGVQRVPTAELELFIIRGFLDSDTCATMIARIDARRRPSEIADDTGIADFRTSETCDLDSGDPAVAVRPPHLGAERSLACHRWITDTNTTRQR